MADLRSALRNRLKSLAAELAEVGRRHEQLLRLQNTIEAALIQEEALHAAAGRATSAPIDDADDGPFLARPDSRSLSKLLVAALRDGPKTLEELKQIGTAWFIGIDDKAPGRAINFALVGLQKGGHVERLVNGAWNLVSVETRK
jgi:hypothetical protein